MSFRMPTPWVGYDGRSYRWVNHDERPEFGQVWYNETSELLFIRRVEHEFETMTAQVMEEYIPKGCVYVGKL